MNRLEEYLKAEAKILTGGASYRIGDRELTRANLSEIRAVIEQLQDEEKLKKGGRRKQVTLL